MAPCLPSWPRAGNRGALPNPVGYATIAWPREEFPQALEEISALGFKGVQMLGWTSKAYAGPKISELQDRLQELRLQPVAFSCSKPKLDPAKSDEPSEDFRTYADFFKRLGGMYLQVTDGGDPEKKYTAQEIRSLGSRMNDLGKMAQDFGLTLGYHPHSGTLGETREGLARVLEATDSRSVRLIADVAHLTLGGAEPAEVIRTYRERLAFVHLKDLRHDALALARQGRGFWRKAKYRFCEIGTGVVDFQALLRALREVDFRGWVIVELDSYEPRSGGPGESARMNRDAVRRLGFDI